MSELSATIFVLKREDFDKWKNGEYYIFTGYHRSFLFLDIPESKRPQTDVLYTRKDVMGFLDTAGENYDKNTCYINEDDILYLDEFKDICRIEKNGKLSIIDNAEFGRRNFACFIRSALYEFMSFEMWDEDNNKSYEYAQRIHEQRIYRTPVGEEFVIEVVCMNEW